VVALPVWTGAKAAAEATAAAKMTDFMVNYLLEKLWVQRNKYYHAEKDLTATSGK
jgi:hypothetical protein